MKKFLCIFLISAAFPVLNVYATDYNWAWLWSDHQKSVDGKTYYRMIADIGLDTGSVKAYLDLPDKALTYELAYWGQSPLDPSWYEYGRVFYDPPPGGWWQTTYQFRTDDGLTTPLFSHVSTNFIPMEFVQAQIAGRENPTITFDSVANADQYRVRLYDPSDGTLLFSERIDDDGSPSYSYTYTGDLFLQYDYLWVVLEARDYDGDQLLNRSKIYYEHSATPVGEYVITLKLKNVPEELTFYQDHVPDNALEYSWRVFVDTDGNPSTGDWEGYDVEVSITNWKFPGSKPITKSIIDGTQKNTWILSDTGGTYGHPIKAEIDYNTNTIMMIVREDLAELSDLDITDRFRVMTDYYSPGGPNWDETSENQPGTNTVSDPEGDVGYDFIDILEGKIEYRMSPHDPTPDIKANGRDEIVLVTPQDTTDLTISLDPGSNEGELCDWWIVILIPPDTVFPVFLGQIPLLDLPAVPFFSGQLSQGVYGFLFIIDDTPDGILGITWYDYVFVLSQLHDSQMKVIPDLNDLIQEKLKELMKK